MQPNDIVVTIKNISAAPLLLTEFGDAFELAAGAEMVANDQEAPNRYRDPGAVLRALNELTGCTLYRALHASPPKLSYTVVRS
jgi:hypothetical protein